MSTINYACVTVQYRVRSSVSSLVRSAARKEAKDANTPERLARWTVGVYLRATESQLNGRRTLWASSLALDYIMILIKLSTLLPRWSVTFTPSEKDGSSRQFTC